MGAEGLLEVQAGMKEGQFHRIPDPNRLNENQWPKFTEGQPTNGEQLGDFRLQPGGKQEGELGPKKNTKVPVQSQFDLF